MGRCPGAEGRPQAPETALSPGALKALGKGLKSQPTYGKPEATVPHVGVECFAGDAGFHHHREVFRIQLQDSVHMCQVDTDTTLAGGVPRGQLTQVTCQTTAPSTPL